MLEAYTSGGQVNIFDLLEIIGKKEVIAGNAVTRKIVEGLGNARYRSIYGFE